MLDAAGNDDGNNSSLVGHRSRANFGIRGGNDPFTKNGCLSTSGTEGR